MEKVIFTALSKQDLEALVIDCVQVCLKRHAAQQPVRRGDEPGPAMPPYVSKREAARLLMCSTSSIDNYARAGKLQRCYVGKSVKFNRQAVLDLAQPHLSNKQKRAKDGA